METAAIIRIVPGPGEESFEADEELKERPGYAVFEGAATGGLLGAVLGWVIAQIAERRRSS